MSLFGSNEKIFEICCDSNRVTVRIIKDLEGYFQCCIKEQKKFDSHFPLGFDGKEMSITSDDSQRCVILIRGEIVVPKKKEVIIKYEIE